MADLTMNHRLAQGTLGSVVGGLDSLNLQESPQPISHLQQLLAGAHSAGPWRSLATLSAQRHHQLQRGIECLSNQPAALLQGGPVDCSVFIAMPLGK